ncbi:hypothetical protein DYQ93_11485 [Xanthomonas sp. LMG 8992]|uniref:baseplate megatron protein TIM-barrel domain-containing protein n=1 Tax=Xanthomonas sp. LMG 8992 TaxID=1591157 RepID=UPI00136A890E|nr:glycoside hydrolase TIM-barrel-like domain-containing protein [Xanthomonas sp. LMG 8992]MXV11642.1 hypothetical protein [Xanthomonas sp. LMG 8992]
MADPGYLSNAELAAKIVALVQKYNLFTDEQWNFFTTTDSTVQMTGGDGQLITVPSLAALSGTPDALSVYTTVAAGLAATKTGQYFNVLEGDGEYLALYLNQGGLAVSVARYPNVTGVAGIAFAEDLASALAPADAVMLTPFNEFDLDTVPQVAASGEGFNTTLDELVYNITLAQAQTNFVHMVRDDLARLPSMRTVMVWTQWFSECQSNSGANPGTVQPAINGGIAGKLSSPAQWAVAGKSAATALQLNGQAGGTQNDASLIRGMRHLQERGYEIGFVPIVLGWVNTPGIPQSQALVWRGFFNWETTQAFADWIASYKAFLAYYIALFQAHGIEPSRWLVGSEFDRIVTASSNAQWALFVEACKQLADQVKAAFPACKVTYAANYSDYGVGGRFRLDALWTYHNIDSVGIEWYFPLSEKPSNTTEDILAGLVAGENMDYTLALNDDAQRTLSGSSGRGKLDATRTRIDASAGIKNTLGFWAGAHYVVKQAGYIAQATPLPGYGMDHAPYGLGGITGTAIVTAAADLDPPQTSGQHPAPPLRSTYLEVDGASTWGQFKTPAYTGGDQAQWRLELDYRVTANPAGNYARLMRMGGAVELMIDSGTLKLGIGPDGNQFFVDVAAQDTLAHALQVTLDRGSGLLTVVHDGSTVQHTVPSAQRAAIPSDTDTYLGGYNANSNLVPARFHRLGLSFVRDGVTWGGVFWFDEAYAGVRTAWVPRAKPMDATELGFASISGTSTEPSQFTYADIGSAAMALPDMLDDTTRRIYQSFIAKGWKPTQVYSAYGSTFCYAPYEQAYALRESLRHMASLQRRGALGSITLYNIDARPAAAMTATLAGALYYSDAPTAVFGHAVNGKLAGGSTLYHSRILATGGIF